MQYCITNKVIVIQKTNHLPYYHLVYARTNQQQTIKKVQKKGVSRARANKILKQKAKGQQKGLGSKKGKRTASNPKKDVWMKKIRVQRAFLKELKEKSLIETATYSNLYRKAKGGFFRSKKHIKLYIDEHRLIKKE